MSRNRDTLALGESRMGIRRLAPSCMEDPNMAFRTGEATLVAHYNHLGIPPPFFWLVYLIREP